MEERLLVVLEVQAGITSERSREPGGTLREPKENSEIRDCFTVLPLSVLIQLTVNFYNQQSTSNDVGVFYFKRFTIALPIELSSISMNVSLRDFTCKQERNEPVMSERSFIGHESTAENKRITQKQFECNCWLSRNQFTLQPNDEKFHTLPFLAFSKHRFRLPQIPVVHPSSSHSLSPCTQCCCTRQTFMLIIPHVKTVMGWGGGSTL